MEEKSWGSKRLKVGAKFTFQQQNDPKCTSRAIWIGSKDIHVLESDL